MLKKFKKKILSRNKKQNKSSTYLDRFVNKVAN